MLSVLTERASFISKLLLNEMPENVDTAFAQAQLQLLPTSYKEFSVSCSCPDYAVPCKHIAGVFYRLAQLFDEDPFLLFEMRGLSAQQLQQELLKSPFRPGTRVG
ncbi:SWIM zinc finger family protein [Methylocucumis oryzae]|uniref:SWIM zinc finger family protein n=1 Tax=Methylocucumis oryzae TaxID=1632867 RepID=UPI000A4A859C|nr:SWIM zinc finger family protein [Methylocucumis oryzae]